MAIPAGPASAALANVAWPAARDMHTESGFFWQGLRAYWRQALALNALNLTIVALLCLNLLFYRSLANPWLQMLTFLWAYLILFWLAMQLYLFPVLVGLERPGVLAALRLAAAMTFAHPLFSLMLLLVAAILTAINVALAILVFIAWPSLMLLLGEQAVRLLAQRAKSRDRSQTAG